MANIYQTELKSKTTAQSTDNVCADDVRLSIENYRVKFKRIPKQLKFDDLWGQDTQVEFVKKSIRSYLSKYLYKSDGKIIGKRSYAISRKLV